MNYNISKNDSWDHELGSWSREDALWKVTHELDDKSEAIWKALLKGKKDGGYPF